MTNFPKIPNFDMEGLKTFFTVAQCKSFSEAAERLHKTPATISYRIKALEDQIGTKLFSRSTRTVELLPAGEHLLEFAKQIYGILQEIPKSLQQLSLGTEPEFRLVINNLLCDDVAIARLLSELDRRFPYTHFNVERSVYMGVWDKMLSKRADFAIGVPSWHPISHDFETSPIGQIDWVFVCAPEHPLMQKKVEPLPNDELLNYVAINVEDTSVMLHKRVGWLLQGQREIVVPTMMVKLHCHLEGVGVGFLPRTLAQPYLNTGRLVERKVKVPRSPSPMGIAWPRNANGQINQFLRDAFNQRSSIVTPFIRG